MAEIFLTNTLTSKKEKFVPIDPKEVRIYTCGPTVYRDVHIGNLRTYITVDILKRVLIYNDYRVKHIKNITDVGHMRTGPKAQAAFDPVIAEALKAGKTPQQIAKEYTDRFLEDEKRLNILPADAFPKAIDNISEMIELTKTLLDKGYAYQTNGTIYFDVKKFSNYGQLSGNTLDKMDKLLKAVRISTETDKKDSADFALWKKAEKGREMKWPSPWGEGFPGWHIECSAMSMKYLSSSFDIHTGGEDNIFPHHENEIAQSEAATGSKFVNFWIHGGYLLVDGKKMARRQGNVYTISDVIDRGFDPLSFRYLCLTTHYRSKLNFTWKGLEASQNALEKLRDEVQNYDNPKIGCAEYEENFLNAINDDLDLPKALSIVWELIKSDYPTSAKHQTLLKFDQVLGLGLDKIKKPDLPKKALELIQKRELARSAGDWNAADEIREQLKRMGVEIEDTITGPVWIVKVKKGS